MLHKTKLKIVFWSSLIIGVGLCIGGVFLTPLLAPGGILLAASLGMFQSAFSNPQPEVTIPTTQNPTTQSPQSLQSSQSIQTVNSNGNASVNGNHENNRADLYLEQNIGIFFVYKTTTGEDIVIPVRTNAPSPSRLVLQ